MKAGLLRGNHCDETIEPIRKSVRPSSAVCDLDSQEILPVEGEVSDSDPESDTEGPADGVICSEGERLRLPKDTQFMRRILDPREPTENEIRQPLVGDRL